MIRSDQVFGVVRPSPSSPFAAGGATPGWTAPVAPSATLRRTTPRPGRGQVTSYGEDRVCAAADCATKLSRYNSTLHCVVHQERHR